MQLKGVGMSNLVGSRLAALALVAFTAAACVATGSSSSASGGGSPANAATPAPTPIATATPTPELTPGVAPAGAWTGIHWVAGPATGVPVDAALSTKAPLASDGPQTRVDFGVYGWSRGYVGFRSTSVFDDQDFATSLTVIPTHSTDGLHWADGEPIDIGNLDLTEQVRNVLEGPAGLLALGSPTAGVCGGPTPYDAFWLSADGISWHRVAGGPFYTVDGGSAGYVATDIYSHVWTSTDAVSWHVTDMSKAALKGIDVQAATAFSGGFVIAGSIPVPDSAGCGGVPNQRAPSLWWSADGRAWSRDALSGVPVATYASATVQRISDTLLLAVGETSDDATDAHSSVTWSSTDGRAWTVRSDPRLATGQVVTNGSRGLLLTTDDNTGATTIWAIGDDLSLKELPQTGSVPAGWSAGPWGTAFGPAGLVTIGADGTRIWVGVPTAG